MSLEPKHRLWQFPRYWQFNKQYCEGDQGGVLQKIPQLNYTMKYVTTYLQEIPQRIR